MLHLTHYAITLGSTDLVVSGDYLEGEIVGPVRSVEYQPKNLWRASYKSDLDRGLVQHALSFSMRRLFSNVIAAQQWQWALAQALPTAPSTLTITGISPVAGGVWSLTDAVIVNGPEISTDAQLGFARYSFRGGQWQQVTPP
jgi:hypothetical protein